MLTFSLSKGIIQDPPQRAWRLATLSLLIVAFLVAQRLPRVLPARLEFDPDHHCLRRALQHSWSDRWEVLDHDDDEYTHPTTRPPHK